MTSKPYHSVRSDARFCASAPVALIGGAHVDARLLDLVRDRVAHVLAADGGANQALRLGVEPERVWGDFDSLSPALRDRLPPERLLHIAEQDSTDFEKALRHISAPLIYGLGFTGERRDHELAACHALTGQPDRRVVLVSNHDVVCLAPPRLRVATQPGERISLFPMGPVQGSSIGLHWPIDGLTFSPMTRIGTSNHADGEEVSLQFDRPAMLLIMPLAAMSRLSDALADAGHWSAISGSET